ncbi:mucin-5AC-like [Schistocerca serialis cubense]|uniref:mucin-5AC-like n=1 Tax=Schistocerca serialis cubense TaxID=2023355 RepID=UPI00214E2D18|nr:mucin-5AC-like [Schistocerca serialis cubense]
MASGDSQVFSVLKVALVLVATCAVSPLPPTWASLAGADHAGATLTTISFPELLPPTRVRRIHRYAVRFPVPRPYPVEKLVPYAVPHPVPVPVDAPFQVPVQHPVQYGVPHPVPIPFPQDIPIPVPQAVPVAVNHPYPVPVRKPEPYPVKHLIPYGVPRPFPVPHPVPVSAPNGAFQVGEQLENSLEQNPGVSGFGGDFAPTGPGELLQPLPVGSVQPQILPTAQGYPLDQTPGVTATAQHPLHYPTGGVLVSVQQQPAIIAQNQQQTAAISTGADNSQQQDSNIPLQYALVGLIQQQLTAMQTSNQSSIDTAADDQSVSQPPVQPGGDEETPQSPVFSDEPGIHNTSNEELPASESPVLQLQLVTAGTPQYQSVAVPAYHQILHPAIPIPAPPLLSNGSIDSTGPLATLNVSYDALTLANSSSIEFPHPSDPHMPHPQDLTPTQHENQVQQSPEQYHQLLLSSFGDYNQQKDATTEVTSEAVVDAVSETTPAADAGLRSTTADIQDAALVSENLIADLQHRIFLSKHQQQTAAQLNFTQDHTTGIDLLQKAQDQDKLYQKQLDVLQNTFATYKQQLEQKFIEQNLQQNNQGVSQHYQSAFALFPLSTNQQGAQSTTTKASVALPATPPSALIPKIIGPQSQTPAELVPESTSETSTGVVTTTTTTTSAPLSLAPQSTSAPEIIITSETATPSLAVSPAPTREAVSTTSSVDASAATSANSPDDISSVSATVTQDAITPTTSTTSTLTSTLVTSTSEQPTDVSTTTQNPVSSTSEQPIQTREAAKQQVFAPVRFRQPVIDTVPTQVATVEGQLGSVGASQPVPNVVSQGGQQTIGLAVLVPYQQQSFPVHQQPQHQPVFTPYYQPQPQQFLPPFSGDGVHHQWSMPM